ncbi:hypothetical protein [Pseudomonas aeruginosa]|uniref:hypothetical protein n=1 Tax=Pseudomonas aeruginosa TaxID=287 RepID=UPI001F4DA91D|nr:hypothetical protein [Pseudomonas aeruginosa]
MNLQNRNNLILSLIAETQFDAYVQGYMAKAGAAAGASDNLLVEAEGAAMLQGLVAPVRAQQRACGQPLQNALLQIAHDLLLQTKSQLAIAANASSIHVIQRDMNRAIWNIATAIDHLAEFAQPSQDTVKVIERLMLFVGSSPSPEGQQLAGRGKCSAWHERGGPGMKPMIQAHLVERDQFGFWTHPNYPDLADNCSSSEAQETLRRLGLELQNVFMESDAPRLYDSARSDQRYSEWIPTRPEGAGWFVLSIHDTDNGPVCQYVRPLGEHLSPIGLDAAAEQHERLLSEACAKALNQRDVAQARVAELEHVLRVVVNAADHGSWPTTVMHGIEKVREVLAGSAPPAKAQHSVPDGLPPGPPPTLRRHQGAARSRAGRRVPGPEHLRRRQGVRELEQMPLGTRRDKGCVSADRLGHRKRAGRPARRRLLPS